MPILAHPGNPSIQFFIKILQTYFLGPILTNLVNLSLSGGISYRHPNKLFLASFRKTTYIHWSTDPSLSTDDLNNFRPISNLNFISRMLKKSSHIQSHLSSNSLFFSNLLTGSFILLKLLSHLILRQSQSMFPSLHFLLFRLSNGIIFSTPNDLQRSKVKVKP